MAEIKNQWFKFWFKTIKHMFSPYPMVYCLLLWAGSRTTLSNWRTHGGLNSLKLCPPQVQRVFVAKPTRCSSTTLTIIVNCSYALRTWRLTAAASQPGTAVTALQDKVAVKVDLVGSAESESCPARVILEPKRSHCHYSAAQTCLSTSRSKKNRHKHTHTELTQRVGEGGER